jgi:hypothetical protein
MDFDNLLRFEVKGHLLPGGEIPHRLLVLCPGRIESLADFWSHLGTELHLHRLKPEILPDLPAPALDFLFGNSQRVTAPALSELLNDHCCASQ